MLRVVIVGYGEMFTNLIAGTLDAGCEIVGVYRKDMIKYSAMVRKIKDVINPSLEHNYIKSYKLPEIVCSKGVNSKEFKKKLLKLNPDIILVGSWCEKFSKETYSLPKIATINAHPSLLPKYRGPNPYFWVIKNREQKTGVTFHLIDEGYDKGAILAQEEINIHPSDTGETLKKKVVLSARGVVCELLKDLSEDVIIPLQQNEENATYYSYPEELELNFKEVAEDNMAMVKASYPWYKTYFCHNNTLLSPNPNKIFVTENITNYSVAGTVVDADYTEKRISVLCDGGKVLKMCDINLYKNCDKYFTSNYIRRDVKVGDLIS